MAKFKRRPSRLLASRALVLFQLSVREPLKRDKDNEWCARANDRTDKTCTRLPSMRVDSWIRLKEVGACLDSILNNRLLVGWRLRDAWLNLLQREISGLTSFGRVSMKRTVQRELLIRRMEMELWYLSSVIDRWAQGTPTLGKGRLIWKLVAIFINSWQEVGSYQICWFESKIHLHMTENTGNTTFLQ